MTPDSALDGQPRSSLCDIQPIDSDDLVASRMTTGHSDSPPWDIQSIAEKSDDGLIGLATFRWGDDADLELIAQEAGDGVA